MKTCEIFVVNFAFIAELIMTRSITEKIGTISSKIWHVSFWFLYTCFWIQWTWEWYSVRKEKFQSIHKTISIKNNLLLSFDCFGSSLRKSEALATFSIFFGILRMSSKIKESILFSLCCTWTSILMSWGNGIYMERSMSLSGLFGSRAVFLKTWAIRKQEQKKFWYFWRFCRIISVIHDKTRLVAEMMWSSRLSVKHFDKSFVKKWTRNSPRFPNVVIMIFPKVKRKETLSFWSAFLLQMPFGSPKVQ